MRVKRRTYLFVIVSFLLVSIVAQAQPYNSARLSLLYGGSIPFNFNSMRKVANGIEVTDGTILGISMADSNQVGTDLEGFILQFRSFNGQTVIAGDVHDLPLNRIRMNAVNSLGLDAGSSTGYTSLAASWSTLFDYNPVTFSDLSWDTHQLSISYECGKPISEGGNGSLLGEPADYYTVEIEIELMPQGLGF